MLIGFVCVMVESVLWFRVMLRFVVMVVVVVKILLGSVI